MLALLLCYVIWADLGRLLSIGIYSCWVIVVIDRN